MKLYGIVVKRQDFKNVTDPTVLIEKMIKRFSKICKKDGILDEYIRNTYYEKPSIKRRRKRKTLKNKREKVLKRRKNA